MEQQTVTFQLPADIAQQAAAAGLLTDTALLRWLQRELDRRERRQSFFNTIDRLAALEPRLSTEEIEAEIRAARAEDS